MTRGQRADVAPLQIAYHAGCTRERTVSSCVGAILFFTLKINVGILIKLLTAKCLLCKQNTLCSNTGLPQPHRTEWCMYTHLCYNLEAEMDTHSSVL